MSKVIVEKLTEEEISKRGIKNWPIWDKEISKFDWYYDSDEQCLILEGDFRVLTSEGDYILKSGDFVTFKKGLRCIWDIKKPVKKHYRFF